MTDEPMPAALAGLRARIAALMPWGETSNLAKADEVLSEIRTAGFEIVGPLPAVRSVKSLTLYDTLWRLEGHTDPFPDDDPVQLAAFSKRLTNMMIALERAGYDVVEREEPQAALAQDGTR